MKKIAMFIGAAALLTSCTIARSFQVTGEPIGTKKGVAKASVFGGDASLRKATKNGGIKTVGATEVTTKWFIIPFINTKVYGE